MGLRLAYTDNTSFLDEIFRIKQYYELVKIFDDDYDLSANNLFDVTNYDTLLILLKKGSIDYVLFKKTLKSLYGEQSIFDALDLELRKNLIKWYVYPIDLPQSEFDAIFTLTEQKQNWRVNCRNSAASRAVRWEILRADISFIYTKEQSSALFDDVEDLRVAYIFGDKPKLLLWFTNQAYGAPLNVDYTENGFAQKSYYNEEVKQLVVDVLEHGNYEYNL